MDYITYLFIFLLFVIVGMIIALLFKESDLYHGPNAQSYSKKIIWSKKTRKCYHFKPKVIKCPISQTRLSSFLSKIRIKL